MKIAVIALSFLLVLMFGCGVDKFSEFHYPLILKAVASYSSAYRGYVTVSTSDCIISPFTGHSIRQA